MTDYIDDDPFWDEHRVRTRPSPARADRGSRHRHAPPRRTGATPPQPTTAMRRRPPRTMTLSATSTTWVEPVEQRPSPCASSASIRGSLRIGAVALAARADDPDRAGAARGRRRRRALRAAPATVDPTVAATPVPPRRVATVPITAAATAPATRGRRHRGTASAADEQPERPWRPSRQTEPVCAGTYTVIANDYWNRFPKSSGASVEEWLVANDATLDTPLYVGDELCIPAGATAPAPPPTDHARHRRRHRHRRRRRRRRRRPRRRRHRRRRPRPPTSPLRRRRTDGDAPAGAAPPGADPRPGRASKRSSARCGPTTSRSGRSRSPSARAACGRDVHNWCCYGVFADLLRHGPQLPRRASASRRPSSCSTPGPTSTAAYHLYTLAGWTPWAADRPAAEPRELAGSDRRTPPIDSPLAPTALVAQWIEHLTTDQKVGGSTPSEHADHRSWSRRRGRP